MMTWANIMKIQKINRYLVSARVSGLAGGLMIVGWMALVACTGSPKKIDPIPQPSPLPTPTSLPSPTATPSPTPQPTVAVLRSPLITSPQAFTYQVIATYPHDPEAWVEGLVYSDGVLFESTGELGRSSVRQVELATGKIVRKHTLDSVFYGEGLAQVGNRLVQLTWKNNLGFVYDATTFEQISTFQYDHEGWGLAYNGKDLAVSDGTATLRFFDPEKLTEVRRVQVTDGDKPIVMLNELEWMNGEVLANIWQTDLIARIDPQTGLVTGWINLAGLLSDKERTEAQQAGRVIDVLNGIAYDAKRDRLFVTGKLWPKLFEIKLVRT